MCLASFRAGLKIRLHPPGHNTVIATPGTADSFLKGAHVKRTRHAHQVTSSALSIMLRTAYDAYCLDTSEPLPFDDWCVKQVEASPQFHYWYMVMHLECLMLVFVRSIHERKLPTLRQCIESTGSMVLCPGPQTLFSLGSRTYT